MALLREKFNKINHMASERMNHAVLCGGLEGAIFRNSLLNFVKSIKGSLSKLMKCAFISLAEPCAFICLKHCVYLHFPMPVGVT